MKLTKEGFESIENIRVAEAHGFAYIEAFGYELAERYGYKDLKGMDAIYFYFIDKYHTGSLGRFAI